MLVDTATPKRTLRIFATATLITMAGNGAFTVCLALYFTEIEDLSPTEFGTGLSIGGIVGLLAGIPCGHLADRRGPRGVTGLLTALAGAGSATYLLVGDFPDLVLATAAFTFADRGAYTARQALLVGVVREQRALVRARAMLRAVTNIGFAAGAGIGALALHDGERLDFVLVFVINSISFVVSAALLMRVPRVLGGPPPKERRLVVLRDGRYATLTALNMVLFMHFSLLEIAVPLWIVTRTEVPQFLVGVLLGINTVTVALLQIRVAEKVNDLASATRGFQRSSVALSIACVLFALAASGSVVTAIALLMLAAMMQVYGEMVHSSAAWTASFAMARQDKQGQYQGLFATGFFASQTFAPAVFTLLLIGWGVPGWIVMGTVFVAAGWATAALTRAER